MGVLSSRGHKSALNHIPLWFSIQAQNCAWAGWPPHHHLKQKRSVGSGWTARKQQWVSPFPCKTLPLHVHCSNLPCPLLIDLLCNDSAEPEEQQKRADFAYVWKSLFWRRSSKLKTVKHRNNIGSDFILSHTVGPRSLVFSAWAGIGSPGFQTGF